MKTVKLGVVGCGVIGNVHLQRSTESQQIDIVAVADRIEEKVTRAAEGFSIGKTYSEGSDLAADPDVEAVILAFPTGQRTELALQALRNGKHVLLDKPCAMNAGEVSQMMDARGDLTVGCCSSRHRFTRGADQAEKFLAGEPLGDLRLLRVRSISPAGAKSQAYPPTWRLIKAENGGGFLVNWGVYDMDYLLGITGWKLRPRTVLAQTWPIPPQLASYVVPQPRR